MTLRRAALGAAALLAVALVVVAAAGWWFADAAYRRRSAPATAVTVVIPRGTTFESVTARLADAGVLAEPLAFRLLARLRHETTAVQAGEYRFPPHQTAADVLRRIVTGQADAIWVTFPEGYTIRQIGARLASARLVDANAFDRYARSHGIVLDGARTPTLEGYLFPSTYLMRVQITVPEAAAVMTDQFQRELPPDATARAKQLGYTIPQIVTIASMIEREAKADDERPIMAGVYYNRLRLHMPLQVDATLEYAFASHHDVITDRDLQTDSPYNTYRHRGLPPTPIANPGKASLDAAFFPAHTPYLYYVYKGNGHHAFATTFAQHEANVAKYEH